MSRSLTHAEFEALYRSVAPELYRYLQRRGAADPDDLLAEVFTTAWRRRSDLPSPSSHRAWLFGTARRLLAADHRKAQQAYEATVRLAVTPMDPASEDASAERIVTGALGRLSPDDRELIQLVEWERLTPNEIAVALGVRPGTVRVRLHRARQALASDPQIQALLGRSQVSTVN